MGNLIVCKVNLNDKGTVSKLRDVIDELVQIPSCYYPLKFEPKHYFEVPTGEVPKECGWYIILEGTSPYMWVELKKVEV